jgi:hypothetical protein
VGAGEEDEEGSTITGIVIIICNDNLQKEDLWEGATIEKRTKKKRTKDRRKERGQRKQEQKERR